MNGVIGYQMFLCNSFYNFVHFCHFDIRCCAVRALKYTSECIFRDYLQCVFTAIHSS